MLVIGDVHGKIDQYLEKIQMFKESICVGDFGFKREWDWLENKVNCHRHKVVMGNHDWYPYLDTHPASLRDWSQHFSWPIFTIRGANSIDKHLRTEGTDWFPNEEVSYSIGNLIFDNYCQIKPEIMISHDCPQMVMEHLFGYEEKSLTRQLLQSCFEAHQPRIWIFGHHHRSKNETINGTKFRCLSELETYII